MRLLSILMVAAWWLWAAVPASAQPAANYTAEVEIDVTSADAATARDKGMKQAYRGAFLAVARNMTSDEGVEKLNTLTDEQLLNFISEAEVLSEKASDVRYMARLKVQINGELLKAYMQEQGIPLIVMTSANVIVIPVFREFAADAPLLWESDNLWRKAWENTTNTGSINNYISVPADGINYAALDADKAVQMNSMALDTVASHLGG